MSALPNHVLMTASEHKQAKVYRLRIPPATPGHNYDVPDFVKMSVRQRKSVITGHTVTAYVDQVGSAPIIYSENKFPLSGLCAISPVVKNAIKKMKLRQTQIKDVALPEGNVEAYNLVFAYISSTLASGFIRPIQVEYETPLFKYYHVLEIATNLQITPLMENLGQRYEKIVTFDSNYAWTIDANDIRKVYKELDGEHPLRLAIVKNVASAWLGNGLHGRKLREIQDVTWECVEFWEELQAEIGKTEEAEAANNDADT